MPRKPRTYLPGIPAHVVQRGNDRNTCFFEEGNYLFYLQCLDETRLRYRVSVHAYVLMTNHVHLLVAPQTEEGISRLIQFLGNRHVQYVNKKYRRTGTLWEGRHKGGLVDAERYLLACYRYTELNPVRANMVTHPSDFRWSSYHHHATGEHNALIDDHEIFKWIARNKTKREECYRELFRIGLDERNVHDIRKAAQSSMPLGDSRFKEQIARTLGRAVGYKQKGRPVSIKIEECVTESYS